MQERIDLTIKDIVEQTDKRDLLNFAYELRKQDSKSNKYTDRFLQGTIKPKILFDIIRSNRWSRSKEKMLSDLYLQFTVGNGNVMQYKPCLLYTSPSPRD